MEIRSMADAGLFVRARRLQHDLTQAELAQRLGVSRAWVVRLEAGAPRLEAQRVLDAFVALGSPLLAEGTAPASTSDDEDPFATVFDGLRS